MLFRHATQAIYFNARILLKSYQDFALDQMMMAIGGVN